MQHGDLGGKRITAPLRASDPPADFVGRDSTLREVQALVAERAPTVMGLRGAAGVGKTALGLVLAQQLASRYAEAQIYIDLQAAAQPMGYAAVMGQVVHAFNPLARLPEDEPSLQAAYRQSLHGRRALLIYDNVGSGTEISHLLPPAGCLMLVTAGERLTLSGLKSFSLAALSLGQAKQLLLRLAPRIDKLADKLAALCGMMPLALQLAGRALAENEALAPSDYAQRLEAERGRRARANEVEAAANVSYSLMTADLQRLWRQLAVFPGEFDRHASGVIWQVNERAAGQALEALARAGLVTFLPATRRYRVHNILRRAANNRQDGNERLEVRLRHAAYYVEVLTATDEMFQKGGFEAVRGLQIFDRERSNILAGQAWVAAGSDKSESMAELANRYGEGGANVLAMRLPLRGQMTWFEAASRAARRMGDRAAEAVHLAKLGSVYRHIGDPRGAAKFYEQCLRLARETKDRRQEGLALDKLGLAWADMSFPRRAAEYYEQSLQIARELGLQAEEARTSWNLGLAYKELDDLPAAISAMQVCVDYERKISHPNAEADATELEWLRARLAGRVDY